MKPRGQKRKCWFCKPVVVGVDGADHVGVDAYLRCTKCGWRTLYHVECVNLTPEVERILRNEWRAGPRSQTPEPIMTEAAMRWQIAALDEALSRVREVVRAPTPEGEAR